MKHLGVILVVLSCLLCPGTGAAVAEKLVVGFEDLDFYPYGKTDDEQIFVGYLRSLLEAFAADRGHQLELEFAPLKRLYMGFQRGDVDLFTPDNPAWSEEYKQGLEIYYSDVITVALDGFAVLPGRERETVGDRIGHVGTILGFTIEPLFGEAQKKLLVFDRVSRFESIFGALLLGRVDAVYCNLAVTNHVLEELGKEPSAVRWSETLPSFKSPFHVSSTRQELIAELDDWLRSNPAAVKALKEEYGILDSESRDWGK